MPPAFYVLLYTQVLIVALFGIPDLLTGRKRPRTLLALAHPAPIFGIPDGVELKVCPVAMAIVATTMLVTKSGDFRWSFCGPRLPLLSGVARLLLKKRRLPSTSTQSSVSPASLVQELWMVSASLFAAGSSSVVYVADRQ